MGSLRKTSVIVAASAVSLLAVGALFNFGANRNDRASRSENARPVSREELLSADLRQANERMAALEARNAELLAAQERDRKEMAKLMEDAPEEEAPSAKAAPQPDSKSVPSEVRLPEFEETKLKRAADDLRLDDRQEAAFRDAYEAVRQKVLAFEAARAKIVTEEDAIRIEIPSCEEEWKSVETEWKGRLSGILTPSQVDRNKPGMDARLLGIYPSGTRFITILRQADVVMVNLRMVDEILGSKGESNSTYGKWERAVEPYRHLLK